MCSFCKCCFDGKCICKRKLQRRGVVAQIGYNANTLTTKEGSDEGKMKFDGVDFTLSSWHLWKVADNFGLGFRAALGFDIGVLSSSEFNGTKNTDAEMMYDSFRFSLGPAFGYNVTDYLALDVACGLGITLAEVMMDNDNSGIGYAYNCGFDAEIRAKFFPKKLVSPVLGYKFTITPVDTVYAVIDSKVHDDFKTTIDAKNYKNDFYLGCSINF